MKTAVVYNRESQELIDRFGIPNRHMYGKLAIKWHRDSKILPADGKGR